MPEIKDNGTRVQYEGGALRELQDGKGRCDLLPPNALLRLARHFEGGAKKYGDRNWEHGMPKERFVDSGFRHLLKFMGGETDEDHLVAATWNFLCLLEYDEREAKSKDVNQRDKDMSIIREYIRMQNDLGDIDQYERMLEYMQLNNCTLEEAYNIFIQKAVND